LRAAALALGLLVVGCGGGGSTSSTTTTATGPAGDQPATLPHGWKAVVNDPSGFSVGVPPGWTWRLQGSTSLLAAPRNLVAISIAGDRTEEARTTDLTALAAGTVSHLHAFDGLAVGEPQRFRGRYPAVIVTASGSGRSGQRLRLIVMRPPAVGVFTLLGATKLKSPRTAKLIDRIARTVRFRPVAVG
jgi:hypothetical protein